MLKVLVVDDDPSAAEGLRLLLGTDGYEASSEHESERALARLRDEQGRDVQSEKVIEIDWSGGVPVRNGDQFGIGRVSK